MAHNQFELLKQRRFLPFFLTQALGAFNDNVYRQAIIGLLGYMAVDAADKTLYTNLAPAIFILPYFLFSATAGQIAEKLEKSRLIRITTTMEIVIMSLAAIGFLTHNLPILLAALFCTGLQSTLFGPVKYSILPSVLKPEELTGGNGLVEMGTSISILIGMIFGGVIFKIAGDHGPVVAAIAIIVLAVTGNLVSRAIPRAEAGAPELKINWNPLPESLAIIRLARKQVAVRNSILGVSWFWFVGTVLTANIPSYTELNLGMGDWYVFPLALFSIGTGVGSMLCEKLSARTVEIGLVPLGAFGMSAFLFDLYFARTGLAQTAGLDIAAFMQQPGSWRIAIDLVGIGLFTGFFVVPLFALIQSRTAKHELSRVIAGMNIQNAAFIVLAAVLGVAVQRFLHWTIPQVFLALAVANVLVAIWIFTLVPEFLMRFMSWVLVRALYRLRVKGVEQIPDEGAALVVCNHVSYMDALILSASIPRPVRFVMYYKIFNIPVMSWIFRTAKAIPIAGARENPEIMRRAFEEIEAALADGQIVGIFPEGALTKDGEIAKFKSGVEHILEKQPVPVIPMALRGMWTSMWSHRDSRMSRMRVPRRFRAQVEVVAAAPVDGAAASAEGLEAQVRALRGDAA
ncbi:MULTISPECIES: MFS transporter [unclassified Lysobacter]|uniref:MFS transporter n=1 Tax=unclassified Lysobacter TaxID=2635362 RepID=UPI00070C8A9D|nr:MULTISPECIES: MFS transporter [unclassified Lysobacter]KRD31886.1 glycerol acyltransferase [Lysobacter sp. Root916]KRD75755.1 glycerol acyltransferase [Lysobacter sp. Root983]